MNWILRGGRGRNPRAVLLHRCAWLLRRTRRRRRDQSRSRMNWILRGGRGRNPRAMLLHRCAWLLRRTCRRSLLALKGLAGRRTCRRKSAYASSRRRAAAKSLPLNDACGQQQKHPGRERRNGFHNASQCQGNHKKARQGKSTAACHPPNTALWHAGNNRQGKTEAREFGSGEKRSRRKISWKIY